MKALILASCVLAATPAHADDDECPQAFRGARVRAENSPGGVHLVFRNRANVSLMREQLRQIADMLERHGTERQTSSEDEEVEFPPVDIEVKDIALGARVTIRVSRLRDLTSVRELAFGFAEYWKGSVCVQEPHVTL
jgi:hypothetical protein